jgi:predicted ATP-dependent serine protease
VGQADRRLREAAKLGFKRGLLPRMRGGQELRVEGLQTQMARSVVEAVNLALERHEASTPERG